MGRRKLFRHFDDSSFRTAHTHPKSSGGTRLTLSYRAIHRVSQFFRDAQYRHIPFADFDLLVRARIASHTGRPMLNPKRTKSSDLYRLALLQRLNDGRYEAVHDGLGFDLGKTGARCNAVDDVGFRHGRIGSNERKR